MNSDLINHRVYFNMIYLHKNLDNIKVFLVNIQI